MKNILIIQGNPDPDSLCYSLAEAYTKGVGKQACVQTLNIAELEFDLNLAYGYKQRTELEPDLLRAQELITWADHLVLVYPVWWGSVPALMKGFLDRVLLPGYAFKYRENSPFHDPFLMGKTARQLVTLGMPNWYYWLRYGAPSHRSVGQVTLNFCGIRPVKTTVFSPLRTAKPDQIESWLPRAKKLGERLS